MKVLLVPFAPSLAHVGRCLAMAEIIHAAGFQILFAVGPERISMIQKAGFETRPLPEVSGAAFRSGRGFGWLTGGFEENIKAELAVMQEFQPDLTVFDFRFTTSVAARLAGIPAVSILHGNAVRLALQLLQEALIMSKVIIQECSSYELTELMAKINAGINELGGWNQFIRPGMKVLLKVNLIGPKASETAAVTHSEFVRALARILKTKGCIVWIGDSAGGSIAGIAPTAKAFEVSGLKKMAEEEGVELKNFDREGVFAVSPRRDPNQKMYLAKPLFDADLVLNLPKLKTHSGCSYTGAIKNLFGCIPGLRKAEYHKLAPSTRQLGEVLANIHQCSKVDLHIMDAVTAMDGRGPTSGAIYRAGKILISADPLALDTVAAKMIGLDIAKIPIFDAARARNLGCFELAKIEIAGDYQSIPVLHGFRLPRPVGTGNRSSKILGKIIDFLKTRPIVNVSLCKQCNVCVDSCPVQVIDRETKKIDYSKCIECLCCHELCMYRAIILKNDNRIAAILMSLFQLNQASVSTKKNGPNYHFK